MAQLRLRLNAVLTLIDQYGTHKAYYVRQPRKGGQMLQAVNDENEELLFFSDEKLYTYYSEGRWRYDAVDSSRLTPDQIARANIPWEAVPAHRRTKAERRELIVLAVKDAVKSGARLGKAMKDVPKQVVADNAQRWAREDYSAAEAAFKRRKEAGARMEQNAAPIQPPPFKTPSPRTVWEWCYRYMIEGERVKSLALNDDKKGKRGSSFDDEVNDQVDRYIEKLIEQDMIGRIAPLYKKLKNILEANGLKVISYSTFKRRLRLKVSRHQVLASQKGLSAANLATSVTEHVPDPDWPLQQVEVDHTLADMHLRDDLSDVILGRPWITMVIDRLTRLILGCHVSFLPPSWATFSARSLMPFGSRISAHIRASSANGITMAFPTRFTVTEGWNSSLHLRDAPRKLSGSTSKSGGLFRLAQRDDRTHVRKPESSVYTYEKGITFIRKPGYAAHKNATVRYSEFRADLLQWIIDHNHGQHKGLAGQISPVEMFDREAAILDGTPPVSNVADLRHLMGESTYAPVTTKGVTNLGLEYNHPAMAEILDGINTAGQRFEVRYDPYNLAAVDVLIGDRWITAYAKRPDIASGLTAWQHRFHVELAKSRSGSGIITEDMVARARAASQADFDLVRYQFGKSKIRTSGIRLARYMDVGQFFTPINLIPMPSLDAPIFVPGAEEIEPGCYEVGSRVPIATPVVVNTAQKSASAPARKSRKRSDKTIETAATASFQSQLEQRRLARRAQ